MVMYLCLFLRYITIFIIGTLVFTFVYQYNIDTINLWRYNAMEKSLFEKMGGTYRRVGDYYIPNLSLPEGEDKQIGIWGQRHRRYLKQNHRVRYMNLVTSGKLNSYLADVDVRAEEMFSRLVKQMAEKQGVTEQMKTENQMLWVQEMNNIQNRVKEIINHQLIYA